MASVLKSICRKKGKADKFLITASVSLLSIDCRKKNGKEWKKKHFFVFVLSLSFERAHKTFRRFYFYNLLHFNSHKEFCHEGYHQG